jgi:hypothetical protein
MDKEKGGKDAIDRSFNNRTYLLSLSYIQGASLLCTSLSVKKFRYKTRYKSQVLPKTGFCKHQTMPLFHTQKKKKTMGNNDACPLIHA